MKWNFEGKNAFITGGASGIGRQIAMDMASNGASVAILDMNEELGNKTVEELKKAGNGKAIFLKGSVSDKEGVEKLVDQAMTEIGDFDFLINCFLVILAYFQ